MKRKICIVITARPSYSRIKSTLAIIVKNPNLELQLVVAASALLDRYGSTIQYIERDGFKINDKVYIVLEGENLVTMAKTVGLGLIELATSFDNLKPDLVVAIADRYETLATAAAAAYMNIPVVHIQGGEVTGSIDEKVRHAVTKLSNYHFVSTKKAAQRIIKMGEDPKKIFITGCPSIDLAKEVLDSPELDFDPIKKYGGVGEQVSFSDDLLIVIQHPVTTEYEEARKQINETLHALYEIGNPTVWIWPNVDAGSDGISKSIRAFREKYRPENMHFFKNMMPKDFLKLIYNSRCIIGNSSVAIRECSFLGVPAVNIGTRQSGREHGKNVIDVGYNRQEIINAIDIQLNNSRFPSVCLYGDGKAGKRIASLLASIPLTIEKKLTY